MTEVVVTKVDDVEPGSGKVVEVEGRALAVFNVDGTFCVLDNTCLHRGGPLGEGELEDDVVTCPWHGWQYDVRSGRNVMNPSVGVRCYAVRVENGEVHVEV